MQSNPRAPLDLSPYQKWVILFLALTQFTVILDFMVMSPLGDMLMKSMGLSTSQFGMSVSAYAFSAGISGLLTAGFADKYDRKNLLIFFYIGFIAGTLLCGLATSFTILITARIVTGIFGGVIGSISMAIVADLFSLEKRGRVMGLMQTGFGASQVLGIPISLFLANRMGWQSPFFMIVGLSTLIVAGIIFNMKPVNAHLHGQHSTNALKHLWKTLEKRNYRIGFLTTSLLSLGGFMMMPWNAAFSINNLHVLPQQLPYLFMVGGISTLIIMPLVGRFSDRIDKFRLFTIATIWMMIVVVIYTNLTPVPFFVVILINILLMIGIMGRMIPSMALITALPEMHDRGAFMSINTSLQQIAGGIAAAVGGMIVVQKNKFAPLENFNVLGLMMVGISIICIVMLFRVNRIVKKPAEPVISPITLDEPGQSLSH